MNRGQFEHAIRAAGAVLGSQSLLVIGSQAIHATTDVIPPEASRSVEVDIAAMGDEHGELADLVDATIGEASMFHETFGYYAQGVSETTAILPDGWRNRLIPFEGAMTGGVTAHCLEVHDLWVSKAAAGRPKDLEFCMALLRAGLVDRDVLKDRLQAVGRMAEEIRSRATSWIDLDLD